MPTIKNQRILLAILFAVFICVCGCDENQSSLPEVQPPPTPGATSESTPESAPTPAATPSDEKGGSFESQIGQKMKLEGLCLDGTELDWESYRGKYVLVDFWTTWCGFCIREIPFNKKLYERYHDAGFEIIAFSCDDDVDALKEFAEKNPEPWTIVSSQMSADAEKDYLDVPEFYQVPGYPTMVLVDPEGKIVDANARGKHLQELLEKAFPDVPKLVDEE